MSLLSASIGGQMGLFIGASVLTIMEFIEIIFLLLFFILKRLSSKHRNSLENADIWADIRVHRKKIVPGNPWRWAFNATTNSLIFKKISFITCKSRFYIRFTFVFHFWRIWRTARRRLVDGSSFPFNVWGQIIRRH